jgi:hypothetical protein
LAVSRGFEPKSFFLCLLMLQEWAVRQFWPVLKEAKALLDELA